METMHFDYPASTTVPKRICLGVVASGDLEVLLQPSKDAQSHVVATPHSDPTIVEKTARSILRIKSRVVKVRPDIQCGSGATALELVPSIVPTGQPFKAAATIIGPEKTRLFDSLVEAQIAFQKTGKTDPAWVKKS